MGKTRRPLSEEERAFTARVGARMALARRRRGVKMIDLAPMIGVTPQQLGNYEAGSVRCSIFVLIRVARILGVPLEWFVLPEPQGSL